MRPIDADALIKDIAESIRLADEWEKESNEKKDKHGLKCAIDTRRSLLAMISRVKEAPTIEAEPVRRGHWIWLEPYGAHHTRRRKCSKCGEVKAQGLTNFCPNCGARMEDT